MIEAGINDGDYVVVKEQQVANNGEIIVALIEDGATVKRFYKEATTFVFSLRTLLWNPSSCVICAIVGKVVCGHAPRVLIPAQTTLRLYDSY